MAATMASAEVASAQLRLIQRYIEQYGKEVVEFFVDELMFMNEKGMINKDYRDFLVKHKVIKKSTKTARGSLVKYVSGTRRKTYAITIRNGRNERIFNMNFSDDELPEIIKMLE